MKSRLTGMGRYALVFVVVLVLMVGALAGAAMIPKSAIKARMEESASLLTEKIVFFEKRPGKRSSMIDRYADSILLSITYQLDREHPLESAMRAAYYKNPYQNENYNFSESLKKELAPNQEYLRYWHGSAPILRVLHLFWNLSDIYRFHRVLLLGLFLFLEVLLFKRGQYRAGISLLFALLAVGIIDVPDSLEYTWTFLLAFEMAIAGILLWDRRKGRGLFYLFLVGGMLTSYLDFLTTETITLLLPLLVLLVLRRSEGEEAAGAFRFSLKAGSLWAAGYVLCWAMKWVIASAVLGENVMPYVWGHVTERVGVAFEVPWYQYLWQAVVRNAGCLFPVEYVPWGAFLWALSGVILLLILLVFHQKRPDKAWIGLYLLLGLLPYVRYLVIHNHSYVHHFFTYRAQAASLLAAFLIFWEMAGGMPEKGKGDKRDGRRGR